MKATRPRRLFRSRRGVNAAVSAAVADRLGARLRPGTFHQVDVWHDADCKMPEGGPCTCKAVWSGRLAAMLFSLFQTLALWGINPRPWLTAYLTACADAGGQASARPDALLPWNLSEDQRRAWSMEPRSANSS